MEKKNNQQQPGSQNNQLTSILNELECKTVAESITRIKAQKEALKVGGGTREFVMRFIELYQQVTGASKISLKQQWKWFQNLIHEFRSSKILIQKLQTLLNVQKQSELPQSITEILRDKQALTELLNQCKQIFNLDPNIQINEMKTFISGKLEQ